MRALLLVLATLVGFSGPAAAAQSLDSYENGTCCQQTWVNNSQLVAQLIPISSNSGLWASVALNYDPIGPVSAPLNITVFRGPSGGHTIGGALVTTSSVLATITFPTDTPPLNTRGAELTLNLLPFAITVNAGDVMTLVFESEELTTNLRFGGTFVGSGKGGLFVRDPLGGSWTGADLFTNGSTLHYTSYVQPVPEPSTVSLVGLGAAALVWFRRRIPARPL